MTLSSHDYRHWHRDQAVVPLFGTIFRGLCGLEYADEAGLDSAPDERGRIHQKKDIFRVTVIPQRRWNVPEIIGKQVAVGQN
jgi:hypothetical protein